MISLPTIGLDQFLRTPAASFPAQPAVQVEHWITDSLIALPCFALSVWAGDLVASRTGIGTLRFSHILKRSIVTALLSALIIAPAWLELNKTTNPVVAQPIVFPQAHDRGDVYSVAPGVIVALVCVCLVPAAFWAGRALARALTTAAIARVAIPVLFAAAVPVLAWLMSQAAANAYASQVYTANSPVTAARRAAPTATAPRPAQAPHALASQAAHALQDGLAGQALGLPAAALTATVLRRAKTAKDPQTHGAGAAHARTSPAGPAQE